MALRVVKHYTELIKEGRLTEMEGDIEKAAVLYEEAIRQEPLDELPYNRLMIIYRKLGQPGDELKVITKALKVYQQHYDQMQKKLVRNNPKAAQLSKALLHSMNGNKRQLEIPYYPQPISKWFIRKTVVEKKLAK